MGKKSLLSVLLLGFLTAAPPPCFGAGVTAAILYAQNLEMLEMLKEGELNPSFQVSLFTPVFSPEMDLVFQHNRVSAAPFISAFEEKQREEFLAFILSLIEEERGGWATLEKNPFLMPVWLFSTPTSPGGQDNTAFYDRGTAVYPEKWGQDFISLCPFNVADSDEYKTAFPSGFYKAFNSVTNEARRRGDINPFLFSELNAYASELRKKGINVMMNNTVGVMGYPFTGKDETLGMAAGNKPKPPPPMPLPIVPPPPRFFAKDYSMVGSMVEDTVGGVKYYLFAGGNNEFWGMAAGNKPKPLKPLPPMPLPIVPPPPHFFAKDYSMVGDTADGVKYYPFAGGNNEFWGRTMGTKPKPPPPMPLPIVPPPPRFFGEEQPESVIVSLHYVVWPPLFSLNKEQKSCVTPRELILTDNGEFAFK